MNKKNQLIKTFCDFVKIYSPTGKEKVFSDYLKCEISKLGFESYQDSRDNLFVSVDGVGDPILFVAHIDTVEPGKGIVPVIKNGVIESEDETILGADNKAFVAILFELLRNVKSLKNNRAFEILFSVSEEGGVSGIDTFDFSKLKSETALCFDISRPVGTIVLSSPYYLRQEIKLTGKEADASNADRGLSVVPALAEFLSNIPQGLDGEDTFCNIGKIHGGRATNALISEIRLDGEIRSFEESEINRLSEFVEKELDKVKDKYGCDTSYDKYLENCGYTFSKNDLFVEEIKNKLRVIIDDSEINIIEKYWGLSDANNLNREGIKTLNLGYGVQDAHTAREKVSVKDIEKVKLIVDEIVKDS